MLANGSMKTLRWGLAGCLMAVVCTSTILAQSQSEQADEAIKYAKGVSKGKKTVLEMWDDLLYYINVAKPELVISNGEAIFDTGIEPKDVYLLSTKRDNSLTTLRKGRNLPAIKDLCNKYLKTIEKGYLDWRADPSEISRSIAMLGKSLEAYRLGVTRIKNSGEYALPQLIQTLMDPKTSKMHQHRIVTMLHLVGPQAIRAYTVALQTKNEKLIQYLANALRQLEYPTAIPRLREVLTRKGLSDQTKNAVKAAIIACSGGRTDALSKSPADLFYQLAVKYYQRADSVCPDPRFDDAFVWFWKPATGLEQIPVAKEILCDIYAERMARITLKYDPTYQPAVPVWLAALTRRELDLPQGKKDPLWPDSRPNAEFYLLAASPQYRQQVLAMAQQNRNTQLIKTVIRSMAKNLGPVSQAMRLPGGGQPLVSAMGYPDLTVRFLAAETLALAMPTKDYHGSAMVLNLLNTALRQKGKKYAMVLATNPTERNKLKAAVRDSDFEVIDQPDLDKALISASKAPGLDIVLVGPSVSPLRVLHLLRRQALYFYLPVLACKVTPDTRALARKDGRMVLIDPTKINEDTVADALEKGLGLSKGKPLDEDTAVEWAIRAAKAIRTVGSRSTIYKLTRSIASLKQATQNEDSTELQIAAAGALAVIKDAAAQQAAIALGLKNSTEEEVKIAAFKAAAESVLRFGNQCTEAQRQALVDLVSTSKAGDLHLAAAQLLGAMNLKSEKFTDLIQSTDVID